MEYSLRFAGGQEINIQKSLTSMVFVSALWQGLSACGALLTMTLSLLGLLVHPDTVYLVGHLQLPENQMFICRTTKTKKKYIILRLKTPSKKICAKIYRSKCFQKKMSQTPWWTDSEPDELAPIITEVQGVGEIWSRLTRIS